MTKDVILGILRHALTTVGGSLVAKGTITGGDLDVGVGAIITLAGIIWSIRNKTTTK